MCLHWGGRLVSVENLPFTHVGIGFETGGWHDDDLVPACVLVAMLGGGDSFCWWTGQGYVLRLYRKVLNQCAWVESILGVSLIHNDAGCIGIVGSTLPQYAPSLLRVIDQVLWVATEPAEEEELDRARNRLKSSVLMNGKSTVLVMIWLAKCRRMASGRMLRMSAGMGAVTADDIMRVAMRRLNSNPSVVAYGDMTSIPDNIHELVQQALKESMPPGAEGQ